MMKQHGMSREQVDSVTNKRHQRPYNYRPAIYGVQAPVAQESDVLVATPVTTAVTTVSAAPTTAPPADTPGGDAL